MDGIEGGVYTRSSRGEDEGRGVGRGWGDGARGRGKFSMGAFVYKRACMLFNDLEGLASYYSQTCVERLIFLPYTLKNTD